MPEPNVGYCDAKITIMQLLRVTQLCQKMHYNSKVISYDSGLLNCGLEFAEDSF